MINEELELIVRRLERGGKLSNEDRAAVLDLPFIRKNAAAATYLVREGEPPRICSILLSGFAYRHKLVGDGGRQIVALHIPGEALDLQSLYLDTADHNVQTLTPATLATVPMSALRQLIDERPALAKAILTDLLVEASVLREWIANIGRRDARSRLAHLLCEFACRLDAQGLGATTYELPMTQEQLGDALGLTSVHVNRSIKALEADGLISRSGRTVSFPDLDRLREVGDFSALYLHLGKRPLLA